MILTATQDPDESHDGAKERRNAAILSLLLPGMGQVYQGHYRRGIALFAGFAILASITESRLLLPLAAILVAAEAFRGRRIRLPKMTFDMPAWATALAKKEQESPYRLWIYGIVASLGFCLWIGLVIPVLYPYSVQATINDQVDELADWVRGYAAEHGSFPTKLSDAIPANARGKEGLIDPWGTPYEYSTSSDGFEIQSAGPDKKMGTPDDYVFHFR